MKRYSVTLLLLFTMTIGLTYISSRGIGFDTHNKRSLAYKELVALASNFKGLNYINPIIINDGVAIDVRLKSAKDKNKLKFKYSFTTNSTLRDRYYLDPWGSPYWIAYIPMLKRGVIYSFGPNKKRDTDIFSKGKKEFRKGHLFRDDLAAWFY